MDFVNNARFRYLFKPHRKWKIITPDVPEPEVKLNNKLVKPNKTPKLLGVTLDKKLTFSQHINNVEQKAAKSLGLLLTIGKCEKIRPKNMICLYKSLVLPQLEYASSVWQIGDCSILESVQRKALAICLGVPCTAGREALEVQAGLLPLERRREELALRECCKIMAKDHRQPINKCLNICKDRLLEHPEKIISPIGKMLQQIEDMKSLTGINLATLEPEVNFLEFPSQSRNIPKYWNNLGSSRNRTQKQIDLSKEVIKNKLDGYDGTTVIAFTDGSCKGNPGPCGSGACVSLPNQEQIELKRPVSKSASILLGELVAVKITLELVETRDFVCTKLVIFSDSQTTVGILEHGWSNNNHKDVVREIRRRREDLEKSGITVQIEWTPGHADIPENDIADKLAKEAANEASELDELSSVTSMLDVQRLAKEAVTLKWQRMWDASDKGRYLYTHKPKVQLKKQDFAGLSEERFILQLQSGYCRLNDYMHKIGTSESKYCSCGSPETVEHYLTECENYEAAREMLRQEMFTKTSIADFTPETLLNCDPGRDDLKEHKDSLHDILGRYITETKRFAKDQPSNSN